MTFQQVLKQECVLLISHNKILRTNTCDSRYFFFILIEFKISLNFDRKTLVEWGLLYSIFFKIGLQIFTSKI